MPELYTGDGAYSLDKNYTINKIIGGLSYPSNIAFDPDGNLYVTEAGFTYPFIYKQAKIFRLSQDDNLELIIEGLNGPLIGMEWHNNGFLVTHRGTLSKISLDGTRQDLVTDIPSFGDHHTNHLIVKNEKVYFGQGTITNSGIVGTDNLAIFGWLATHKHGHDVPAHDVVLAGKNYKSINPFNPLHTIETGAYSPLGTPSKAGQIIKGRLKSNGVVYRCNPDGSELDIFAWGLRNPYGIALDSMGRILVLDQGGDGRGNRPVESPDALYEIKQHAWYGWPDFYAGQPITHYTPESDFVMQSHPPLEQPLHTFQTHASSVTIDFSTSDSFGYKNHAFIAQYGTEAPFTTSGKPVTAGRKIIRLDLDTLNETPFFESNTIAGIGHGPNRPVAAKFSPDGNALYVIDHGVRTLPKSGGIWKITRNQHSS